MINMARGKKGNDIGRNTHLGGQNHKHLAERNGKIMMWKEYGDDEEDGEEEDEEEIMPGK